MIDNKNEFIDTDQAERVIKIDKDFINLYMLPPHEYMSGSKPEYIFLHHTAGWHNPYRVVDSWANDTRGKIGTEFLIGGPSINNDFTYDGEIVKCMPDNCYAWHLGIGGKSYMHHNSIGIELNNFGFLQNNKTHTGRLVDDNQIVKLKKPFRGYQYWHRYSDSQINSLKNLLYYLADKYNIDITNGLPKTIKELGADAFEFNRTIRSGKIKGVHSHTNVTTYHKYDVFPQEELMDMLINL